MLSADWIKPLDWRGDFPEPCEKLEYLPKGF